MSYEEKKQIILKYIASLEGKATQNDVVHYMDSDKVPSHLRLSRPPTIDLINELEKGRRIKISKGERRGQSHRLSINTDSKFKEIQEQIGRLGGVIKSKRSRPNTPSWDITRWGVQVLFIEVKKLPSEQDSKFLYPKIVDLMTELTIKEIEELRRGKIEQKSSISERENQRKKV